MALSLSSVYPFLKMKLLTVSPLLLCLDIFVANFTVLRFCYVPLLSLPAHCDKASHTDLLPTYGTSPFIVLGPSASSPLPASLLPSVPLGSQKSCIIDFSFPEWSNGENLFFFF